MSKESETSSKSIITNQALALNSNWLLIGAFQNLPNQLEPSVSFYEKTNKWIVKTEFMDKFKALNQLFYEYSLKFLQNNISSKLEIQIRSTIVTNFN